MEKYLSSWKFMAVVKEELWTWRWAVRGKSFTFLQQKNPFLFFYEGIIYSL